MELIQKTISIATLVFVLSSMLATGLGLTVSEIITPLRNTRLVVLSLLANFVLMPLAAVGLAALLRLDQPLGVGLLLLGTAAGAPFLPKLAQISKGNLAFGVGLMVLLMVVTVGLSAARPAAIAARAFRSTRRRLPGHCFCSCCFHWLVRWLYEPGSRLPPRAQNPCSIGSPT